MRWLGDRTDNRNLHSHRQARATNSTSCDDDGMRIRDVRIESQRNDQAGLGVTALVDDGVHVLVQIGLRRWPDDGSADELTWTATDPVRQLELGFRGGGLGGGVHPDEGATFDGGFWFEGSANGPLCIRCRHHDELLLDIDLVDDPLSPIPSPIERLDVLEADKQRWLGISNVLEGAGWRRGRAVADEIIAIDAHQQASEPLGVVPFAVERWGRLLRVGVTVPKPDGPRPLHPPDCWVMEIGGHLVDAISERFQSGRSAGLIGHLVMLDPAPGRPLGEL